VALDGRALADGALPRKKNLLLFLGFFAFSFCRVLFRHSAKASPSARQKALGKNFFAN